MGKFSLRKNKRLLSLMIAAGVLVSALVPGRELFADGIGIEGSELKSLGDHKTYNAVIFENHTASKADIEGQVAVGEDITAPTESNNFGIGAAWDGNSVVVGNWITDTSTPTFLLGGVVNKTPGNITIETGTAAISSKANKNHVYPGFKYNGVVQVDDAEISKVFDSMKTTINELINNASKYTASDEVIENANYGVVESNEDSKVLINTIGRDEESLVINGTGHSTNLPDLTDRSFYVFYSDAEEVRFEKDFYYNDKIAYSGNMKELGIAGKILWVFPNAKKVTTIANDVPGNIVCPNAELYLHGGSINGQVFTKDLNQIEGSLNGITGVGGEVHNYRFNWDQWDNSIEEEPEEKPEVPEEKPEVPEEKPEVPEEKPEVPEEKPEVPEEKPEVPEEKPEMPEEKPEVPEEKPEIPEEKPEMPEEKPEVPEEKPEEPEEKPEVPEEKPEIPEEKPEVPEEKPEVPEEKPEMPEEKPEIPEEKVESDNNLQEVNDEKKYEEKSLPKTGGVAAMSLAALGLSCTIGGIYLSKIKK